MEQLNILIIEDNLLIAEELKAELEHAGHHVVGVARNIEESMRLIRLTPPDIALIDITLGRINDGGIRIASSILEQHWMPFIYLTAHSDKAIVEKAARTSPSAFMLKPYRSSELLVQIKIAFDNFRKASQGMSARPFSTNDSFYFPVKDGHERIFYNEVIYIRAQGSCSELFMVNQAKPRIVGTHLGHLLTYFDEDSFFRLSKSLVINMFHLNKVERTQLHMGTEMHKVDISETNRKHLMKRLNVIRTK
jgi:DNA-binding LytR/AlgR family response regulator